MDALQRSTTLLAVIGFGIAICIMLFVRYLQSTNRDSPKLRAISIVLMTYSLAAWAVVCLIYIPYMNELAPTISRHNTFVSLQQSGARLSLFFHSALSVVLVTGGTWFAIKLWRQGDER